MDKPMTNREFVKALEEMGACWDGIQWYKRRYRQSRKGFVETLGAVRKEVLKELREQLKAGHGDYYVPLTYSPWEENVVFSVGALYYRWLVLTVVDTPSFFATVENLEKVVKNYPINKLTKNIRRTADRHAELHY